MKWWLVWVVGLLALAGCSSSQRPASMAESSESAGAEMGMDGMAESKAVPASTAAMPAQREIIRRGSLTVQVEDLMEAEASATKWVKDLGGFVESTRSSDLNSVRASVSMTVRVPVKQFDRTLDTLAKYGTLVQKGISSEDITTQLVDLRARLKVLREQETVLLGFLRESKTLKDSLAVNQELTRVRQDIESMDAVRRTQEELASLSTIDVVFVSPARMVTRTGSSSWAQDAWTSSADSLVAFGRRLGGMGISFVVFSPIWAPVAGIAWWLLRRRRKANSAAQPEA